MLRDLGPAQSPFKLVPLPAGAGNAAAQNGATQPERATGRGVPCRRFARVLGGLSGPAGPPTHHLAQKYLPKAPAESSPSASRAGVRRERFIEALQLFSPLANVGDAKSLAIHPTTTTHQQLTDEQQLSSGVSDDLVRLSIGLEDIDDILWDLDQALTAAS